MTVQTQTTSVSYTANGVTDTFAYPFLIFAETDINVYVDGELVSSGFSLTGVGVETGGNVIFNDPPENGAEVVLEMDIPATQPTDYKNQSSFYGRTHERSFDRVTLLIQQLKAILSRALVAPVTDPDVYDAQGKRIGDLLDGREGTSDAATVRQLETSDAATVRQLEDYVDQVVQGGTSVAPKKWNLTGDGVTVTFPLPGADVATALAYDVRLSGVSQDPMVDFTISLAGTPSITFTSAPPVTDAGKIVVLLRGFAKGAQSDAAQLRSDLKSAAEGLGGDLVGYKGYTSVIDQFPYVSLASAIRRNGLNPLDLFTDRAEREAVLRKTSTYNAYNEIQGAIDYMYNIGGGDVKFTGRYRTGTTLLWKPKVNLVGMNDPFNSGVSQILPPVGGGNFTIITNDPSLGTILGTGDDGQPQRSLSARMENMEVISGGSSADRRRVAVRLTNTWCAAFQNNRLIGHGIAVQMIDCNVLQFIGGTIGGGMFWDSVADSKIIGMEFGPANYPAVDADKHNVILWLNGSGSWKNIIANNNIFNCPAGYNYGSGTLGAQAATFVNGSQNITVTGHDFVDETPVTVEASSDPSGFTALTATYWVKVVDANTIKLASSRANFLAGTFITASSAGAGTVLRVGGRGNLFLNNGSKYNAISGNRFDQSYYSGLMLANANLNAITGNTVTENGRANASGQVGLRVTLSSNNALSGNMVDGTTTGTATGTSNQAIGISISGTANRLSGNVTANHSTLNIADNGTNTLIAERRKVVFGALDFEVRSGTPARASLTSSRRKVWSFPSGSDGLIQGTFEIPLGLTKFNWRFRSTNLGAGSGTVAWTFQYAEYVDGDDITANEPSTVTVSVAAPAQERLVTSTGSITLSGAARLLSITVKRSAAGDTLANAAGFIDMDLEAFE